MDEKLLTYYQHLKAQGISPEREKLILDELNQSHFHDINQSTLAHDPSILPESIYMYHDQEFLQHMIPSLSTYSARIRSIDELLAKDKQREKDGFPRKIRVGRLIKPGKGGKEKVVVVPTTVEEKLIHDRVSAKDSEEGASGGSGEGEEGEVIGEQPIRNHEGSGSGPGEGDASPHEMESSAYDLGKILTEQFELPNLKDKGKKRSLTRYTYDMTDRHRGFGQLLDKKATLKKIVETNISLGNVNENEDIDSSNFLIAPKDMVYRVLSREKDYESQAMVFFLRDYSGSMSGNPTELIVSQHVLIYSWILYQYARQVETRFILHDTDAKEVPDFYTYYNSKVAGGTRVASAYRLVNSIVLNENLKADYNIYIFHGTDGDDWDTDGKESLPELKKMLTYASRIGITIAERSMSSRSASEVEKYIKQSGLLIDYANLLRMDIMKEDSDESRVIEGIRRLISMER